MVLLTGVRHNLQTLGTPWWLEFKGNNHSGRSYIDKRALEIRIGVPHFCTLAMVKCHDVGEELLLGKTLLRAVNGTLPSAHTESEVIWVPITRVKRPL